MTSRTTSYVLVAMTATSYDVHQCEQPWVCADATDSARCRRLFMPSAGATPTALTERSSNGAVCRNVPSWRVSASAGSAASARQPSDDRLGSSRAQSSAADRVDGGRQHMAQ